MSLMCVPRGGTLAEAIGLPDLSFDNAAPEPATVYSGVRFNADGTIDRRKTSGGWAYAATWLNIGTNSDFDILATTTQGVLDEDAGQTALIMTSDYIWSVDISTDIGDQIARVQFDIIDSATNMITYATNSYFFKAEND